VNVDFVEKREAGIIAKKVENIGPNGGQMIIEGPIEKVEIVISGVVVGIENQLVAIKRLVSQKP